MTKHESIDFARVIVLHELNHNDFAARKLSAMVRCASTEKARRELMAAAHVMNLIDNEEFCV